MIPAREGNVDPWMNNEASPAGLGEVVRAAAGNGWSIAALIGASIAAMALETWALALAGLALYALLVLRHVARPAFWRAVRDETRRRPAPLPAPGELSHPVLCKAIRALGLSRMARERALAELPERLRPRTLQLEEDSVAVERSALGLIARAEQITRWLDDVNVVDRRAELADLGELAQEAGSAEARERYGCAQALRRRQLEIRDEIVAMRDACLAELAPLLASLDELPFRLAQTRMADEEVGDSAQALAELDLARLGEEIGGLDHRVQALHELAPTGAIAEEAQRGGSHEEDDRARSEHAGGAPGDGQRAGAATAGA